MRPGLWTLIDHEMGVRRASPHDPSSSPLLYLRGQASCCRVEWPQNYPVRPFRERRPRSSVRVSGALVRAPSKHVLKARLRVAGFGPVRVPVFFPLQSISIRTVRYIVHDPRVSGEASKAIVTFAQNGLLAVFISINYLRRLCDVRWRCGEGTGNLGSISIEARINSIQIGNPPGFPRCRVLGLIRSSNSLKYSRRESVS